MQRQPRRLPWIWGTLPLSSQLGHGGRCRQRLGRGRREMPRGWRWCRGRWRMAWLVADLRVKSAKRSFEIGFWLFCGDAEARDLAITSIDVMSSELHCRYEWRRVVWTYSEETYFRLRLIKWGFWCENSENFWLRARRWCFWWWKKAPEGETWI